MDWLWLSLVGLGSGVISGMGIGGGTLLIPALAILYGIGQQQAQTINLLYFIPTAIVALITHKAKGNIEKNHIFSLVIFGAVGALLGALAANWLEGVWLRRMFGGFLLVMAVFEFFSKGNEQNGNNQKEDAT